jgi:hypothetical protein
MSDIITLLQQEGIKSIQWNIHADKGFIFHVNHDDDGG